MNDQVAQGGSSDSGVKNWAIKDSVAPVSDDELKYSRGYLRCRPEKWFPGFGTQWLPLSHALGTEFVCSSVKPSLNMPSENLVCFGARVTEEFVGFALDKESLDGLANIVSPGARQMAREAVIEYLIRRLLGSFALAWSGPELGQVDFAGEMAVADIKAIGNISLSLSAGGTVGVLNILLGPQMIARMDGLWRRQVKSTSSQATQESMQLDYEIACLPLSADKAEDYLKKSTTLDLQVATSDRVAIRVGGQDWLPGKLRINHGNFVVEVLSGPSSGVDIPSGAKRLGVSLGQQTVVADDVRELAQVGAMINTGIPAGDVVKLMLDNRFVASGILRVYDGRFVATVT